MLLCVGDDWAEDHHDIEIQDGEGCRLRRARVPEGVPGITRFHTLIGECVGEVCPNRLSVSAIGQTGDADQTETVIGADRADDPFRSQVTAGSMKLRSFLAILRKRAPRLVRRPPTTSD